VSDEDPFADVIDRLVRSTPLSPEMSRRVVEEVVAYLDEPVETLVRRRHRELQARGLANPEIFRRIVAEVGSRPVAAPPLTERQVRRTIYG
jgi:polyhydroxyalkanoate synthesis regulator phasin